MMIIDNFLGAELSFLFWVTLEMGLCYTLWKLGSKLIDLWFEE